ncbi:MAG: NADH:ubiquinone reductase (Na(+)-transporting) subunit F [Bacteroidales bacterium]|nr:NADH:ubiquinone reductase (Na(+)-transporting) subunit F [Bacteroidales bacterium]
MLLNTTYIGLAAAIQWSNVAVASLIFLAIVLALTIILLLAKHFLVNSGEVAISINDGQKLIHAPAGKTLLATLGDNGVHLSSACGGKGSCGQCKVQVVSGGGDILPTEAVHFSRKEIKDHWRLGCQVKVKNDLEVKVSESALDVKEWECEVISNKNVATFIKEFIVQLPAGEHMNFIPGSYAQIRIPKYEMDYDKDIDKALITDEYLPAWEKFGLFTLKAKNDEETVRAYSMANYPEEGDRFMLTVRIATPPFKPKPQVGFMDVPPGIASSYIFSLKPGDKVLMSGPYGDFHPIVDSKAEMIWVGGGAGMAPLRAQIMWMTRTRNCRDREMHYFYGARALNEVFYLDDFLALEKEFPNFHFHLALDRPDPAADAAGVKYTPGFVHDVMYNTYLKDHDAPEDVEYYMCGPGPMSNAVNNMLFNLGVEKESIHYDNFGG